MVWVCVFLTAIAAQAQAQAPDAISPSANQALSQAEVVGIYFTPPSDVITDCP